MALEFYLEFFKNSATICFSYTKFPPKKYTNTKESGICDLYLFFTGFNLWYFSGQNFAKESDGSGIPIRKNVL